MESNLVIELKITLADIGYFVGLTPAKKTLKSIWVSHEMNSNQR
jgi:hypothetical protein